MKLQVEESETTLNSPYAQANSTNLPWHSKVTCAALPSDHEVLEWYGNEELAEPKE